MAQSGLSPQTLGMQPSTLSATVSPTDQASIDYLFGALGNCISKTRIKNGLDAAGGNRDLAYEFLHGSEAEREDFDQDENGEDLSKQAKVLEYHEVVSTISDANIRIGIADIMNICPTESPRHILDIYCHFNGNKQDTVSALLDGLVIPIEKVATIVKEESPSNSEGKEATFTKDVKLESSQSSSKSQFGSCRDASSDIYSHSHCTPPSSSHIPSPQQSLTLRPALSADWSFGGLPPLPDSPKIPARQVTDGDGFELEDSDIKIVTGDREIEDEDIYGMLAEDKAQNLRKDTDSQSLSSSDEDQDVEISITEEASGSDDENGSGSDTNLCSNTTYLIRKDRASIVNLTETDSEEEDKQKDIKFTQEEKEVHLLSLFPKAGIDGVRRELQLNDGEMIGAAEDLEKEYGLGGSDRGRTASSSPGIGPSRVQNFQTAFRKRPAVGSVGNRQSKRSRWRGEESDGDEGESTHEPAGEWVLSFLHNDNGIQIQLDSGVHPCRVAENPTLRKVPGFRDWLDKNPPQVGLERIMKVPNVSLETFNLAMQWLVCSVGRFTLNQRRSKSNELTALIELAVFTENVRLPLGGKTEWFMSTLKTILVNHRQALRGCHIQEAFKNLRKGHQVRKLLVQASLKPYAEYYHSGEDLHRDATDSDSDGGYSLNPAQRAAYKRSKFCFEDEFNNIDDYQIELLREFHRVWWSRSTMDQKYSSRHFCHITTVTDPLTDETFNV